MFVGVNKENKMQIRNSTLADFDEIFRLYAAASAYQTTKNVTIWPQFDENLVKTEIHEHRQWKVVIENTTACVWATTFEDPFIWEEKNADPAVYIHRIATNPVFRGQNFVVAILDWAKEYAVQNDKKFVRLDTIGDNTKLIEHYQKCGFTFLGTSHLTNISQLPAHYSSGNAKLFEYIL